MKISRFRTSVHPDSFTPQISFCVNMSIDELSIFATNFHGNTLEERELAFGRLILEEISNARIKELKNENSND